MLYEPVAYQKVLDHENIVDYYNLNLQAKDFRENREVLKELTPTKIFDKFLKQLN